MTGPQLVDSDVPNHPAPLPVEASDHRGDPTMAGWTNLAREVWEDRNPGVRWEDVASYPVLGSNPVLGWLSLRAQTGALATALFLHGRKTGHRGTHPCGVGARGTLTIDPQLDLPDHPFFEPGKRFPVRVRHANGSFFDDAACTVRGCAIKFADSDFESPLDLMMNSGSQGPLWSTASFLRYTRYRVRCDSVRGDFEPQAKLMDIAPAYLMAWNEAVRDAPDCFSDLTYYSRVVFPFFGRDGVLRYMRFRVRRLGLERESGMSSPERQARAWDMRRDPDDDRPLDYARQAFARRVRTEGVAYRLQVQLRDVSPQDTNEVFHLNRPWSTETCPWRDLAQLDLTEVLDPDVTERMRFSEGHQPEGMGVFRAPSAADYRSIGWSRLSMYWASQWGRKNGPSGPPENPYE